MKEYFPQIEEATRFTYIFETASMVMSESDKRVDVGMTCLGDTSFFKVFDRKCLAGNLIEPLGIESDVVISSKLATKMAAALTSGKKMDEKAARQPYSDINSRSPGIRRNMNSRSAASMKNSR